MRSSASSCSSAQSSPAKGAGASALRRLVATLDARGITTVVLTPETEGVRRTVPRRAVDLLHSIVAGTPSGRPVTLVDSRASIPDALFHDPTHLGIEGRKLLTKRLGRALAPHLGAGDSPDERVHR